MPTTVDGLAVAPSGTLQLTVFAETSSARGNGHSDFREIARADYIVRPDDFRSGAATYRLPFDPQRHPELDPPISHYGIVHARLGVVGQGVFEATDDFVRLLPFSPPRDRLFLLRGQRFLPAEAIPRPSRGFRWQP